MGHQKQSQDLALVSNRASNQNKNTWLLQIQIKYELSLNTRITLILAKNRWKQATLNARISP